MHLVNEDGAWKVQWDEGMILPELAGGNQLAMEYSIPARGDIYDREGLPIVSQADAFAFGIQTDQIDLEMINTLVTDLGRLCGFDPEYIRDQIDASGPAGICPCVKAHAMKLSVCFPSTPADWSSLMSTIHVTTLKQDSPRKRLDIHNSFPRNNWMQYRRLGYNGSEKVGTVRH